MLIREVTQPANGMDKMVALVTVLAGRAKNTGAAQQIGVDAFVNLAKSMCIVIHPDDLNTLVSQEPLSNVFEPMEPNTGVLKFKGNDEQTNNMPVDAAQDIVAQNAKRAMKK